MASYPTPQFVKAGSAATLQASPAIDVQKWTEEATQSLNTLSIKSPTGVRGTSVSLAIDLDEQKDAKPSAVKAEAYRPKRKLLRRDSLDRREALLRGKEGSRRRTRWENDHLLNNPWAQPPLPSDWEPHPTYPRHVVPYYLAHLWDQELAARTEVDKLAKRKGNAAGGGVVNAPVMARVPKELRQRFKKSKAAKGLLHSLEEEVRRFVSESDQGPAGLRERDLQDLEPESSDEEIVFVGRNGKMRDVPPSPKFQDGEDSDSDSDQAASHVPHQLMGRQRLVLESPLSDRSAGFGRWLVHIIAAYYGLQTWSRTIGNPAMREAYVGLPKYYGQGSTAQPHGGFQLPKPLWVQI